METTRRHKYLFVCTVLIISWVSCVQSADGDTTTDHTNNSPTVTDSTAPTSNSQPGETSTQSSTAADTSTSSVIVTNLSTSNEAGNVDSETTTTTESTTATTTTTESTTATTTTELTTATDSCTGVYCNNGTCRSLGNNYTCDCNPGLKGDNCTEVKLYCDSNPCSNNGNCSEDLTAVPLYYRCQCASNFRGDNCSEDVHECENTTLCGHGFCSERLGSYKCICLAGWTGEHCETNFDPCAALPCAGKFTNYCRKTDVGSYTCVCQPGFIEIDGLCQKQVIWPYQGTSFSRTNGMISFISNIPYPYFETASQLITINGGEGYVTIGGSFNSKGGPPQTGWPSFPKVIGVYWSDFYQFNDAPFNTSYVYFQTENRFIQNASVKNELLQYVVETVGNDDFEPLYITVVTWVDARPSHPEKFPNEKAYFQLILATDSLVTYAIRGYQTVWSRAEGLPRVSTSYSLENGTRSYSPLPSNGAGPEVIKLSSREPSRHAVECVQKVQNILVQYDASISSLPVCPCYQTQADIDERYMKADPSCYLAESEGSNLTQQCCYNEFGILLPQPEKALPLPKDANDTSLQSAYDQCCHQGGWLCYWFFTQVQNGSCDSYTAPFIAAAFGDSHIVTFDKNKYSFNAVGDFVLFRSGNATVELQGRTAVSSNNRTTLFVAFALKTGGGVDQIYISNNKLFHNGSVVDSDSLDFKHLNYIIKIRNNNGTLSVWIKSVKKDLDSRGLLGTLDGSATNDFILGDDNMTLIAGAVSRLTNENITTFVESWRVDGRETLINNAVVPPGVSTNFTAEVLANTAAGVKKMFDSENDTAEATQLCGNKLFCLQDFYIDRSRESALAVLAEEEAIILRNNFISALPVFSRIDNVYSSRPVYSIQLSPGLQYALSTNIWNVSYLSLVNDTFTFGVGLNDLAVFQKMSYPRRIILFATDVRTNLTTMSAPKYDICLCEEDSQCVKSVNLDTADNGFYYGTDGIATGNVFNMACNCNGTAKGRYCEQKLDKCDDCFNRNRSACNPSAVTNYCPPCPEGYVGDGISCYDKDECADNNGGCQQVCTNNAGGFTCSCWPGYSKVYADESKCRDDNECDSGKYCRNPLTFCVNLPGSASCPCYPGLVGDTECIRAPYSFPGILELAVAGDQMWTFNLLVTKSKEFKDLADRVTNSVADALAAAGIDERKNIFVEILSFESATATIKTGRSKREAANNNTEQSYIVANFVMHVSNPSVTKVDAALRQYVTSGCTTYCPFGNLTLFYDSFPKVDTTTALCKYQTIHKCDLKTTECQENDGISWCECRKGYTQHDTDVYSCHDFDECADKTTSYCAKTEKCINLAGSYMCECNKGTVWNATSMKCAADSCSNNPCENDGVCHITDNSQGYVCSCTYGWNGPVCADKDTDARRMEIAVICISAILGFVCLALMIIILVLCVKQRSRRYGERASNSDNYYSEIKGLPRAKVSSNEMEENGNAYSRLSSNRSSDRLTAFNAASSEGKKDAGGYVYQNTAYEDDVVARL